MPKRKQTYIEGISSFIIKVGLSHAIIYCIKGALENPEIISASLNNMPFINLKVYQDNQNNSTPPHISDLPVKITYTNFNFNPLKKLF
ncbi:MAG: hypothetical protein ACYCT7_06950 [bacterium]